MTEPYTLPAESQFLAEAVRYIDICTACCTCTDSWHHLWAGLKASGLRRGVHAQGAQFQQALGIAVRPGCRVLIAGAADAGSLQVMQQVFRSTDARFTVIDRCPAPLALIDELSQAARPPVRTVRGDLTDLQASLPGEQWDVILVHNTLNLMDTASRALALAALVQALAPGGVVLCNARYVLPHELDKPTVLREEMEAISQRLRATLAAYPESLRQVLPRVEAYVRGQQASLHLRPTRPQLHADIEASGLTIVQSTPEQGAYAQLASRHEPQLALQAELLVLASRRQPSGSALA